MALESPQQRRAYEWLVQYEQDKHTERTNKQLTNMAKTALGRLAQARKAKYGWKGKEVDTQEDNREANEGQAERATSSIEIPKNQQNPGTTPTDGPPAEELLHRRNEAQETNHGEQQKAPIPCQKTTTPAANKEAIEWIDAELRENRNGYVSPPPRVDHQKTARIPNKQPKVLRRVQEGVHR